MQIDDIDTPVSEAELSGMDEVAEVDPPVVDDPEVKDEVTPPAEVEPVVEAEPVVEQPTEREKAIPRARFDELNAKLHQEREAREAVERRLAELEQAKAKPAEKTEDAEVDIDALEQAYFDKMMEGDRDEALKIRAKVNAELQHRAEVIADRQTTQRIQEQTLKEYEKEAKRQVDTVFAKAIAEYTFLDTNSPDVNMDAINEAVEWRDFYASKGYPVHEALEKAIAKVAPTYATAKPADPPTPPVVDPRKAAALARNAADAKAQPPAQEAGIGNRTTPPGPKVETQKDWEKLSESEREQILMGG